jgi:hypothetical protein
LLKKARKNLSKWRSQYNFWTTIQHKNSFYNFFLKIKIYF